MGSPNSNQTHVPNQVEEEVGDGVETLSLCDLPLYGGNDDPSVECDRGRSSMSSEEERDQELFEFSSGELGSVPMQRAEKIIFCGRIIHFQERPPQTLCLAKSPGKDCPKKMRSATTTTMHRMKRRRFFRWKLRLFRKPGTGYRKMKAEDDRKGRTYSRGVSGKWYFLMFGSARFPVEMGLRDIKSRQSRRTNPSKLFGLSDYAESEVGDEKTSPRRNSWGLWNILRCLSCKNGQDHIGHRNAVVKVSNGR